MKRKLIIAIGSEFTHQWIESKNNPKLVGFTSSAEYCLIEYNMLRFARSLLWFFIIVSVYILTIKSLLIGIPLVVLGVGLLYIGTMYPFGNTSENIVEDWKPLRKKLLKQGVISQAVKIFKSDYSNYDFVPPDLVRDILVQSIDNLMGSHSSRLKDAQCGGFPQKEKRTLEQMNLLKELTRELGLEMNFDQYFN